MSYSSKRPAEIMTPDEVKAILKMCNRRYATGARDRALIILMYRTGLRIGEALALRPSDVDLARGTVRVLHGKGDKARTVGLGDAAIAAITSWLVMRENRAAIAPGSPLFCTLKGTRMWPTQVRDMLKRRAAKAGVERRVHPHGLRHTLAFELAERGTPVHMIQRQLGHKNLATTAVYLAHIAPMDVIAVGREDPWADA